LRNPFSGKIMSIIISQKNKNSITFELKFSPVEKIDFRGGKNFIGEV